MTWAWNQAVAPWNGDDPRHVFDELSRSPTALLRQAVAPWNGDDPRRVFHKLSRSPTASLWQAVAPWNGDDPRHVFDKLGEIASTSLPPTTTRPPPAAPPQRRRRRGGGRKRYFSQDRIEVLQEACRKILRQKPTLRKRKNIDALVERLRLYLKPKERDVSRDHLLRKIIRPVIRRSRGK